jgi:hypothetical protein
MYSRGRPIRSAAQPMPMLPAKRPMRADAPSRPCHTLGGSPEAFAARVHAQRPHPGSVRCAAEMRRLPFVAAENPLTEEIARAEQLVRVFAGT